MIVMRHSKNHQRGVSLIEVLITLIVLGMGLMSLAKFQGTVMKDNGMGKERTVAVHLAEQKIEDLRSFTKLYTPNPQTNPLTFSFQAIGNNLGGTLNAGGSLVLPSGAVAGLANSNVTYTRDWAVQDWWYTAPNSLPVSTNPGGYPWPSFKKVVVTVRWPDPVTGTLPPTCSNTTPPAPANTRVCLTTYISAANPEI